MKKDDLVRTWSKIQKRWEYGIILSEDIHVSPVNNELYEYEVYFFCDHTCDPMLKRHLEIISET